MKNLQELKETQRKFNTAQILSVQRERRAHIHDASSRAHSVESNWGLDIKG